jgi:hypothetical protein
VVDDADRTAPASIHSAHRSMSVVPYGGTGGILPPLLVQRRIELHRPLQADPDDVMEAVRTRLEERGCTCQLVAPRTVAFDGASFEGFVGCPVRTATVTLDLSNPAQAALRVDARMDAAMVYGWVVAACLALAFVPDLSLRILGWMGMAVIAFQCRMHPLDTIEDVIRDGIRRATEAARLPASTQQAR